MILENFEKTIMKYKRLGAWTSSGVDSSFGLFFILHTIQEKKLDAEVTPIFGNNLNDPYSLRALNYILEYFKDTFYDVKINDTYFIDYKKTARGQMKNEFFEPHRKNISKLCDIDFNFTTEPPVKEEFKELHPEPLDPHVELRYKSIAEVRSAGKKRERSPFYDINKKWIAEQYIKYDLMNDIYPYTISCTKFSKYGSMCNNCFWCKERLWAFGEQYTYNWYNWKWMEIEE